MFEPQCGVIPGTVYDPRSGRDYSASNVPQPKLLRSWCWMVGSQISYDNFCGFTQALFYIKMTHIFSMLPTLCLKQTVAHPWVKEGMKGEDGDVLRSPSCSQAISPKMLFSNIQSLLPGKHVEVGLLINWNECHACFHVFHCSSVHALGLRQVFYRMIEIDHIISHPFPTPFSLLLVHPRSWGDIGRSYILPLPNFVIFHQGGETIGSITGKQSTIAQGNWCRSGMHGLCNLARNGEMEPYLIPKKWLEKKVGY